MKLAVEKIYTVGAFILAVAALGYSIYNGAEVGQLLKGQDEKLERYFRLSLQPNMAFGFYYNKEGSGWTLHNSGAGPAILKWFSVAVTDESKGRIFWIPPGPEADSLRKLNRRVGMQVCYCSHYSECWLAGRDPRGPIRDSCESAPTAAFRPPSK